MSATEQAVEDLLDEQDWSGKIFSDGWVDAPETVETIEPATGEVLGVAGIANVAAVAAATKSAARAQRAWAAPDGRAHSDREPRRPSCSSAIGPRSRGWMVRESGCIPPKADHEIGASIGQLEQAAALATETARAGARVADPGPDVDSTPCPGRRRWRDHAVELPDRARDALDRPCACARAMRSCSRAT